MAHLKKNLCAFCTCGLRQTFSRQLSFIFAKLDWTTTTNNNNLSSIFSPNCQFWFHNFVTVEAAAAAAEEEEGGGGGGGKAIKVKYNLIAF